MLNPNKPSLSVAGRILDDAGFAAFAAAHERFLRGGGGGSRAILRFVEAPGVDARRRLLNDADFTGANLRGALFAGCHLERAALHCADLTRADLRAANLRRSDLRGAVLAGAALNGAALDQADMRAAYIALTDSNGTIRILPRREGRSAASFHDAEIGADFTNCAMRGARLCSANLKGANFTGAVLEAADFTDAKVTGAVFHDAVLSGLSGVAPALTEEQRRSCVFDPDAEAMAKVPVLLWTLQRAAEWAASDGATAEPAILDDADLRPLHSAFRERVLPALTARRVRAIGVDFTGAQLQGSSFEGADLRGAVFEGADLRGVSFKDARLSHARFSRADLRPLVTETGRPHAPVFAGAHLERVDFSRTVLEKAGLDSFRLNP
jgi:uncharacterized protein YjbI with pentapeptide repeats